MDFLNVTPGPSGRNDTGIVQTGTLTQSGVEGVKKRLKLGRAFKKLQVSPNKNANIFTITVLPFNKDGSTVR